MTRSERCDAAWAHDRALWDAGLVISGMDEAGRGPLAGCVTAACVVMPPEPRVAKVFDSKQVSEAGRDCFRERDMWGTQVRGSPIYRAIFTGENMAIRTNTVTDNLTTMETATHR